MTHIKQIESEKGKEKNESFLYLTCEGFSALAINDAWREIELDRWQDRIYSTCSTL